METSTPIESSVPAAEISSSSSSFAGPFCGYLQYNFASLADSSAQDWFWRDPNSAYSYYLNPCGNVRDIVCDTEGSMICRLDNANAPKTTSLASSSLSDYEWSYIGGVASGGVTAYTESGDSCDTGKRETTFYFICPSNSNLDPNNQKDSTFTVENLDECKVDINIYTQLVCQSSESSSGSSLNTLEYSMIGVGSFLVLLILCCILYFLYGQKGYQNLEKKSTTRTAVRSITKKRTNGETGTVTSTSPSSRSGVELNENLLDNEVYDGEEKENDSTYSGRSVRETPEGDWDPRV